MVHDNHWTYTNGHQVSDSWMSCDPRARVSHCEDHWKDQQPWGKWWLAWQVPLQEDTWRVTVTGQCAITAHHFLLLPVPCGGCVRRKRFRACQGEGQRLAGVRKSISLRSLSSPFNVMKPLLLKASAQHLALWSKARMGSTTERRKRTPLAHPPSANSTGLWRERHTILLDVGSPCP